MFHTISGHHRDVNAFNSKCGHCLLRVHVTSEFRYPTVHQHQELSGDVDLWGDHEKVVNLSQQQSVGALHEVREMLPFHGSVIEVAQHGGQDGTLADPAHLLIVLLPDLQDVVEEMATQLMQEIRYRLVVVYDLKYKTPYKLVARLRRGGG